MRKLLFLTILISTYFSLTGFNGIEVKYTNTLTSVKSEQNINSNDISVIKAFDEVAIIEEYQNGWVKVFRDGMYGYIPKEVLIDFNDAKILKASTGYPIDCIFAPVLVDNIDKSNLILIGDSRTSQMYENVELRDHATWLAEAGKGYEWFSQIVVPLIDSLDLNGKTIEIELGINDLAIYGFQAEEPYITFYNTKALEWEKKGARVCMISVKPITYHAKMTEGNVEEFNEKVQEKLPQEIEYVDMNSYLRSVGFHTVDGIHYDKDTYNTIYGLSFLF